MNAIVDVLFDYGLLFVPLCMIANGFISFPPSEVVIPFVGLLIAKENESPVLALFLITISNTIGAGIWYYMLYKNGEARLFALRNSKMIKWLSRLWLFKHIIPSEKTIHALIKVIHSNRGHIIFFIFRFLPVVRSIISVPAGIAKVPKWRFFIFTFCGNVIWTVIWLYIGYSLAKGIISGYDHLNVILFVLLAVVLIVISIYVKKWMVKIENEVNNFIQD